VRADLAGPGWWGNCSEVIGIASGNALSIQ
jgi:hypothetical protein